MSQRPGGSSSAVITDFVAAVFRFSLLNSDATAESRENIPKQPRRRR